MIKIADTIAYAKYATKLNRLRKVAASVNNKKLVQFFDRMLLPENIKVHAHKLLSFAEMYDDMDDMDARLQTVQQPDPDQMNKVKNQKRTLEDQGRRPINTPGMHQLDTESGSPKEKLMSIMNDPSLSEDQKTEKILDWWTYYSVKHAPGLVERYVETIYSYPKLIETYSTPQDDVRNIAAWAVAAGYANPQRIEAAIQKIIADFHNTAKGYQSEALKDAVQKRAESVFIHDVLGTYIGDIRKALDFVLTGQGVQSKYMSYQFRDVADEFEHRFKVALTHIVQTVVAQSFVYWCTPDPRTGRLPAFEKFFNPGDYTSTSTSYAPSGERNPYAFNAGPNKSRNNEWSQEDRELASLFGDTNLHEMQGSQFEGQLANDKERGGVHDEEIGINARQKMAAEEFGQEFAAAFSKYYRSSPLGNKEIQGLYTLLFNTTKATDEGVTTRGRSRNVGETPIITKLSPETVQKLGVYNPNTIHTDEVWNSSENRYEKQQYTPVLLFNDSKTPHNNYIELLNNFFVADKHRLQKQEGKLKQDIYNELVNAGRGRWADNINETLSMFGTSESSRRQMQILMANEVKNYLENLLLDEKIENSAQLLFNLIQEKRPICAAKFLSEREIALIQQNTDAEVQRLLSKKKKEQSQEQIENLKKRIYRDKMSEFMNEIKPDDMYKHDRDEANQSNRHDPMSQSFRFVSMADLMTDETFQKDIEEKVREKMQESSQANDILGMAMNVAGWVIQGVLNNAIQQGDAVYRGERPLN